MTRTVRRLAVLTAPLAVGSLLLAAVPAGAVNEAATDTFGAQTRAAGVRLALAPSPEQGGSLDLIVAAGRAAHDIRTPSGDLSEAFAALGAGQMAGQEPTPFPGGAEASLQDPGPNTGDGGGTPEDSPLPLELTIGEFIAQVDPATLSNSSSGQLVDLSVGSLEDILPAELIEGLRQLQTGLQDGTNQLNDAIAQLTAGLEQVCGPLGDGLGEGLGEGGLGQVTGPITDGTSGTPLSGVGDGLNDLLGDVPATCQDLLDTLDALPETISGLIDALLDTALLELEGLESDQSITQAGDTISGTARTRLANLSILAGFATLEGFENAATASVNGQAGAGTAVASPSVAEVQVADGTLELVYDETGLRAALGELGIAASLVDTLDAALQAVLDGLNEGIGQLGISVTPAEGQTNVAEDGTSATARADGVRIAVTPPPPPGSEAPAEGTTPLVEIAIGDAAVAVAADDVEQPPVAQPAPPPGEPVLPRTGGPALAGMGGLVLVAAAAVALRRRRGDSADLLG